jgi:hypothetical protein
LLSLTGQEISWQRSASQCLAVPGLLVASPIPNFLLTVQSSSVLWVCVPSSEVPLGLRAGVGVFSAGPQPASTAPGPTASPSTHSCQPATSTTLISGGAVGGCPRTARRTRGPTRSHRRICGPRIGPGSSGPTTTYWDDHRGGEGRPAQVSST